MFATVFEEKRKRQFRNTHAIEFKKQAKVRSFQWNLCHIINTSFHKSMLQVRKNQWVSWNTIIFSYLQYSNETIQNTKNRLSNRSRQRDFFGNYAKEAYDMPYITFTTSFFVNNSTTKENRKRMQMNLFTIQAVTRLNQLTVLNHNIFKSSDLHWISTVDLFTICSISLPW